MITDNIKVYVGSAALALRGAWSSPFFLFYRSSIPDFSRDMTMSYSDFRIEQIVNAVISVVGAGVMMGIGTKMAENRRSQFRPCMGGCRWYVWYGSQHQCGIAVSGSCLYFLSADI